MKKYTLVYHSYIGLGSYIISFKRVSISKKALERLRQRSDLHFVIEGWPNVMMPDCKPYFVGDTNKEVLV